MTDMLSEEDFKGVSHLSTATLKDLAIDNELKSAEARRVYEVRSCCFLIDTRVARFMTQILISLGLLIFSMIKLFYNPKCEEAAIYSSLLSGIIAFWLPPPAP